MTNVLPLTAQKDLWRVYRARAIAVFSLALIALALAAFLALVPSYLALTIMAPQSATLAAAGADSSDAGSLARAQALVIQIGPILSATSSPTEIVQEALNARPKGVVVQHIAYVRGSPSQILIDGNASRAAINEYRNSLSSNPHFSSVSVPVGALVGAEGGHFSLTLAGNF